MLSRRWQNKDWTKIGIWLIFGVPIGLLVLGALPDIFEGTGAADTARSAGHTAGSAGRSAGSHAASAGSSAGAMFENIVAFGIIAVIAGIGLWILFKIIGAANRRGGSGRNGQTALRNAQRDEHQAISNARVQGQQAIHQAQQEAQRRRDEAIRAAQQRVSAEQDRWV